MNEEIKFSVLENGLDFIYTALNHLRGDPNHRDLKYAILHLSAGVELILKDRLRRENWSFVFSDIDKANQKLYTSGDFVSVDLKSSIQRLINLCNVDITNDKQQLLINLKKARNKLEHFATTDSATALKSSFSSVLSFMLDFISIEFDVDDMEMNEKKLLDSIRKLLPEFEHFVENRKKEIEDQLNTDNEPILNCPKCIQVAMKVDDGVYCHFCGYKVNGDIGAHEYVESLFGIDWKYEADGGEIPIYACPECGAEALVDIGSLNEDFFNDRFICFTCGNHWTWDEMIFCDRCGKAMSNNSDSYLPICSDCFSEM